MVALVGQTAQTQTPAEQLDYKALDKLQDAIREEHSEHGIRLVAGCRACIYRAAYKVQNPAPSQRQAKEFLANVPVEVINQAIRDVSRAIDNYEQVKEMAA